MRPVICWRARKRAGARGRVVRRVDAHGEHGDVAPEVVERAADLLGHRRAVVLARRVHERHDDRPAAQVGDAHGLAVLVGAA